MKPRIILIMSVVVIDLAMVFSGVYAQTNEHRQQGPGGPPPAGPRPPMPRLEDLDVNNDGSVTFNEFSTAWNNVLNEQFTKMDTNGDNVLAKDELPKPPSPPSGGDPSKRAGSTDQQADRPPMPPGGRHGGGPGKFMPRPEDLDADGDGKVTLEEYSTVWNTALKQQFAQMDTNSDNALSKDELAAHRGPGRGGPPPAPPSTGTQTNNGQQN